MRIDAHQHFWKYDPKEYPWITETMPRIARDFLPLDLDPLLRRHRLDGSVAVQARQTVAETEWLLDLAEKHPRIKGVVGWVDLRSDQLAECLNRLTHRPKLVGVRHVAQDEPDPNFLGRPEFMEGVACLEAFQLTYDILIFPKQLPAALKLVTQLPRQRFVLDHIAKPPIREGTLSPWKEQVQELARRPNVFCKISGMVTEAGWNTWRPDDFTRFLDVVFEAFGPDRVMYGSDWPVALLAASYDAVYGLAEHYIASRLSPADQAKFFGLNAARFYRIPVAR